MDHQSGKLGDWFQSLIGFKINWNIGIKVEPAPFLSFQSLIGFKINWNPIPTPTASKSEIVSIPNRV